ncbi:MULTISPECIES: hydantoinase/oxoprolinase family protein [Pyrobaculum]|uniref:5-oxoprolinase (ATP-hydrolyzing) n=3 Tax=Pyrobaculum TaxID=2276 RepID=A4WHZ6_PYRAR|nr:hydantoinase/oxoprolinase family protein [Pyrobaculum arsenaticum]ABP50013.1 5-oxoprolinase (ATP-hydrolyzing) [Pyrobaculum arsenaticum DSM 13514]MCY0890224.1 hydantoinase/oxoprolinase family protein [Pyrobaculum arsenaticum]NYR15018.1 hydantoinase/oxoprolinase family protein [Pyrobaculum arsenaticum]
MGLVGVDVGGTFTDFVFLDEGGEIKTLKILSTPREPEKAVIEGLSAVKFSEVLHASTIGTNALLGQMGLEVPRVAFFTTRGFRDVVEIGRQNRPRLYDLFFQKPRPLAPRELRFEVDERTLPDGRVEKAVDLGEVAELARKAKAAGAMSVAVGFLHSYANPSNEEVAAKLLREYFEYVTASYEVAWEPREYERFSTALVNAALMPLVGRYLAKLQSYVESRGGKMYVMASSGGLVTVEEAAKRPVQLVESGPAAGVIAAAELAKLLGEGRVISFDMGGTTAKAGTVVDFQPSITTEYEVGGESHRGRVIKGSGYPVRFPFVDLAEVSAGGGTIIWRDAGGALRVGPLSAGADPGPVCYGRGGVDPTVTDANLALGRIPEALAGGRMRLDAEAAKRALAKLGDPVDVASSALRLINLEMARAIRLVTVERGLDPSSFVLMAFGGAGPQHATEVAEEMGINRVLIPPMPGVFTSLGMLMADFKFEARMAYPKDIAKGFAELEEKLSQHRPDYFLRYADVRYKGQGWELTVPLGADASYDAVKRAFEEKHTATYGFKLDRDIEVVTIRVFAVVRRAKPRLPEPPTKGNPSVAEKEVYFDGWVKAAVYNRAELPLGYKIKGPALIVEDYSTTVIPPRWEAMVGKYGVLELRL